MQTTFLVFDTETTGFQNSARVLEVGFVLGQRGKILDTWGQRFNPKGHDWNSMATQDAIKINGITRESVAHEPDFGARIDTIDLFLQSSKVWVGHNLKFDMRMLANEFKRYNRVFPDAGVTFVDTLKYCREKAKDGEFNKLADVTERYGVPLQDAHTAVGDATATALLFVEMVRRLHITGDSTVVMCGGFGLEPSSHQSP